MSKYFFEYKDGYREWWRVSISKSEENKPTGLDDGEVDWYWDYRFESVDHPESFMTGQVLGQYGIVPHVEDIIADIQYRYSQLFLGMAKFGKWMEKK